MLLTAEQQDKLQNRDSWKRVRVCKLPDFGKTAQRRCFLRRLETFLADDQNTIQDIFDWLMIQGFEPKKLGEGVHRVTYSLPFGLVIKVTRTKNGDLTGTPREACGLDASLCNSGEKKAYDMFPHHIAPVYIYNERLNIIIMHRLTDVGTLDYRKMDTIEGKLTEATCGEIKDIHFKNVGRFGKRWLILDAGFYGNE